ncbi:hypothetical protein [Streptomyces griseofuscus]|uniref:hypothetical protein n=1 Tax=Streptomyces griseofuscus TaxID=146922 RepID=UPI0033E7FBE0
MSERHLARVARTVPTPRRLGGGEAAVFVTAFVVSGALGLTGMPVARILQLLSSAGLLALALIAAASASPLRSLSRAVCALLTSGTQR